MKIENALNRWRLFSLAIRAPVFSSVPYPYRLTALLALADTIAGWDSNRYRQAATKWKEYAFLAVVSLIGSMFGISNGILTSRLSSEYLMVNRARTLRGMSIPKEIPQIG